MKKILSNNKRLLVFLIISIIISGGFVTLTSEFESVNDNIVSYTADTKSQNIAFYWKDDSGQIIRSLGSLKTIVESKNEELVFAMNGGMFNKDNSPKGIYIENQKTLVSLDTATGNGNFYLKPNGVFYLNTNNEPFICKTEDFKDNGQIKFATQSGPMLVVNGEIHAAFTMGSKNLQIRNGVGILPGNKVLFAMSKKETNFYDFALYFKNKGCRNALYLDGFVSRAYIPAKNWIQTDGNFGVIIGVTK